MSNEIEAFLTEIESAAAAAKTDEGPRKYVNRDRLVVTIDEESGNSGLHKNYILEGFTPGIEGNYGTSTAVRVVEPVDGRRMTLWLGSHEQDHFQSFVQKQLDEGKVFPMDITFLRHKQTTDFPPFVTVGETTSSSLQFQRTNWLTLMPTRIESGKTVSTS